MIKEEENITKNADNLTNDEAAYKVNTNDNKDSNDDDVIVTVYEIGNNDKKVIGIGEQIECDVTFE